eukprot:1156951-Pelagomonas_calceolata.AAC.1
MDVDSFADQNVSGHAPGKVGVWPLTYTTCAMMSSQPGRSMHSCLLASPELSGTGQRSAFFSPPRVSGPESQGAQGTLSGQDKCTFQAACHRGHLSGAE